MLERADAQDTTSFAIGNNINAAVRRLSNVSNTTLNFRKLGMLAHHFSVFKVDAPYLLINQGADEQITVPLGELITFIDYQAAWCD